MLTDDQLARLWPRQSDYSFSTETAFVGVLDYSVNGGPGVALADVINHILGRLPLIGLDPTKGLAFDEIYFTVSRHYGSYPCDWNAWTAALADSRFVKVPPPDRGPMGCSRWRLGP